MFALLKYFNDSEEIDEYNFKYCLMFADVVLIIYHKFPWDKKKLL